MALLAPGSAGFSPGVFGDRAEGGWEEDGKRQGHLLVLSRALHGAEEEGTAHPASAERFA